MPADGPGSQTRRPSKLLLHPLPMRDASVLLVLAVALLGTLGCRSAAERERTREAAMLAALIDELRAAPHNAKEEPLARLRSSECKYPRACELQQVCVQAYDLHQKSTEASSLVRQRMRAGADFDPQAVSEVLALSEQNLTRAKQLIDECLRLESALLLDEMP